STSIKELITWGVIKKVHMIGDRRDRFEALKDVMETFRVIMAERKRREMDPTISLLEQCVAEAKTGGNTDEFTGDQLQKMLEFVQMITVWYSQVDRLSSNSMKRLLTAGAKIATLFGTSEPKN
ncbi:MAG: TrmB family transcriptional regulator, partial [Planctomycetota bacterium]